MQRFLYQIFFIATIIGICQSACSHGTTLFPREDSVPVSTFSYDGLTGPLNWYGLNKTANSLCAKGKYQSPIDIISSSTAGEGITTDKGTSIKINIPAYFDGAVLENLGTTVEVIADVGTLTDGDKNSTLKQIHFHTPSEHRINNGYYPMEMHFVFQAADESLTVLAFLIDIGPASNLLLVSIFADIFRIPHAGDKTRTGPLSFEEIDAHLAMNSIYRYNGSLTTPPCSEGVKWIISAKPLLIHHFTYLSVKDVVKFNSRYTQNSLGEINLLDNAADELGQVEKRQHDGLFPHGAGYLGLDASGDADFEDEKRQNDGAPGPNGPMGQVLE